MVSYDVCLSLSNWLHSVWQCLGPSMLLQMALFHSFLWLSNIPVCKCVCVCVCVPHLIFKEEPVLLVLLSWKHRWLREGLKILSNTQWFCFGTCPCFSLIWRTFLPAQLQIQDGEGMRNPKSSLDTQKLSCCFLINTHTPAEEEGLTF